MLQAYSAPRRRRWPLILVALFAVIAALWAGGWYFASGQLEARIAVWKEREARAGRLHNCGSLAIGGFPFRIEVRCADADAEFRAPPLALKTREIVISAAAWRPTVLNVVFIGPLTVRDPGQPGPVVVNWRSARTQLHGLPTAPESASIRLEEPTLDRTSGGGLEQVFKASRADVDGRILEGTARDNPVVELVIKLIEASAPTLHPAAARPLDADITAVLRGLKDFSPKPWPARLRELQALGGRLEITKARVQQGDTIAVATGVLGISPRGRLDGQLRLTVANLERLMPALGLDKLLAPQAQPNQLSAAFGALDRIAPGLGNVARQNAAPAIVAGVNLLGQQTELEGKRAVSLPLRFNDGAVSLGPLPLGQVPPLY